MHDIVIVAVKKEVFETHLTTTNFSEYLEKISVPKETIEKLNVKLYALKYKEESTVRSMQLIADDLTKDLIIFHGQYLIDLNLKDAIATHKINSAEMTLVLKKENDLDIRAKKTAISKQFNIYGIGKEVNEVYAMFNSFEANDTQGLSIHSSVLKKCPLSRMTLRSDLSDTGVYIMRNIFKNPLEDIEMIDFDLVKLMVNNQYKKKLRDLIGGNEPDEDTQEIDELLDEELGIVNKVTIMA